MKTFNKKLSIILAMVCIGSMLISSCKKNDEEPIVYGNANIRIVNAVNGSSAQDFYQGDTKLTTTAVAYGSNSGYLTVAAGNSTVSLKNTGTSTVTATSAVGLNTDASYTAFYYPTGSGGGQITGFQDDTTPPPSGKARVRFVNLAIGLTNNINIAYASGTAISSNLASGYVSGYSTIDLNADLTVTVIGSAITGVIPKSNFADGKIYTIWFDTATSTTAAFHVVQQN
jgi:hypothetical protein